jgi:hypothetical protein
VFHNACQANTAIVLIICVRGVQVPVKLAIEEGREAALSVTLACGLTPFSHNVSNAQLHAPLVSDPPQVIALAVHPVIFWTKTRAMCLAPSGLMPITRRDYVKSAT